MLQYYVPTRYAHEQPRAPQRRHYPNNAAAPASWKNKQSLNKKKLYFLFILEDFIYIYIYFQMDIFTSSGFSERIIFFSSFERASAWFKVVFSLWLHFVRLVVRNTRWAWRYKTRHFFYVEFFFFNNDVLLFIKMKHARKRFAAPARQISSRGNNKRLFFSSSH